MSQLARLSKSVTGQLGDLIASRPGTLSDPSPLVGAPVDHPAGGAGLPNEFQAWFAASRVPTNRLRELQYYDYLEREIADVRKSLDAYATMAVTGNLAGGGRTGYTIRLVGDEEDYPDELRERLHRMETMIARIAYSTIRTMVKYGSYMPEIIVGRLESGRMAVVQVKPIPPGTIFRFLGKNGPDPMKYWIQVIDDRPVSGEVVPLQPAQNQDGEKEAIPQWRLAHFAIWSNVVSATQTLLYGSSILQPFGAIGLKLHGVLDSMVLARLTRAAMRYVWSVDVSDIKNDQKAIQRRMTAWKNMLTRGQTLINSNNAADSYKKPPTPDTDFFVPAADGLKWGLDKIEGDSNLTRVGDVELLARFYFGALGVPPEYLGHERSQGGRSNLSQIDINFARTVRHIQMFGAAGFEHIIWVDMLLGGWDPRDFPVQIVPPKIGARDDLLQAQIRALQAAVVSQLQGAGMNLTLNPKWVLQTFLNMDEELEDLDDDVVARLFENLGVTGSSDPPKEGRKSVEQIIRNMQTICGPILHESLRVMAINADNSVAELIKGMQPNIDELKAGLVRSE